MFSRRFAREAAASLVVQLNTRLSVANAFASPWERWK